MAGHSNCDLRRHLDSVPPETPIRDVVDRYHIWESHADPAVRRVSKPSPDPTYPAYVIGDADNNSETTRVAAVTGQKSSSNQLENLLRRVLTPAEPPAPKPEVPAVEKLLQQLVKETQSRPPAVMSPPVPTELEQMLRFFPRRTAPTTAAATATATHLMRLDRRGVFLLLRVGSCSNTLPELR